MNKGIGDFLDDIDMSVPEKKEPKKEEGRRKDTGGERGADSTLTNFLEE
ncbi:MAG: hypothetical protein UT60_C0028G0016 [candidate division CPR2 bacterium GW2011_GWD2_39_7]|nr:MAG: hypothetical protein UT60_C0028G0016 [candidate division CPR2 bacterium GW2011_GWD2_39_7]